MNTITVIYTRVGEKRAEPQVFAVPKTGELPITVPRNHLLFPVVTKNINNPSLSGVLQIVTAPIDYDWNKSAHPEFRPPKDFKKTEKRWVFSGIRGGDETAIELIFLNSETLRKRDFREKAHKEVSPSVRHSNIILDSGTRPVRLSAEEWLARGKDQLLLFQENDPKTGALIKPALPVSTIAGIKEVVDKEQAITEMQSFPLIRDAIAYYLDGLLYNDPERKSKIETGITTWTDAAGNEEKEARYIRIRDTMTGFHRAAGIDSDARNERRLLFNELNHMIDRPPILPVFRYQKGKLKVQMERYMKVGFWEYNGARGIELELPEPLYRAMIEPKPIGTLGYTPLHNHLNMEIRRSLREIRASYHAGYDRLIALLEKDRCNALRGDISILKMRVFGSDTDKTPMYPSRLRGYLDTAIKLTAELRKRGICEWQLTSYELTKNAYLLRVAPANALEPIKRGGTP